MTRLHLLSVLLICLLQTTDALARSEQGEIGLALSWDVDVAQMSPLTPRWPTPPHTAWHGVGRVGAHMHYGLSHKYSIGLGVTTALPIQVAAVGSSRAGATQQRMTLAYRDIVIPIEFAMTLRRLGMIFVQTRLEAGAAVQRWQTHALDVTSLRAPVPAHFDLTHEPPSWKVAPYARLGVPLVWRVHDYASVQCMPYVALIGARQWQVGLGMELSPLLNTLRGF